jgi:hypothetical protein
MGAKIFKTRALQINETRNEGSVPFLPVSFIALEMSDHEIMLTDTV